MKDETIIFKHSGAGTGFYGGFDRWHCCDNENCKDIYGDNKSDRRTLLDTMSKGIKGQQKRHCRLIIHNNTFICHPEHIP